MKTNRELIKRHYIDGMSVDTICSALNISRASLYYHKKKDAKNNILWEELKYLKSMDERNIQDKEKQFLNLLINAYDTVFDDIKKIQSPEKKISLLTKYATTYYKLKNPNSENKNIFLGKGASSAIYEISNIAVKTDNKEVIEFLSTNYDLIIESVISQAK